MDTPLKTLRQSLAEGVVKVRFTKADGNERVMLATTRQDLIVYQFMQKPEQPVNEARENLLRVWDTEKGAWRSIREDRVQEWTTEW
jgi:hypothetical protein